MKPLFQGPGHSGRPAALRPLSLGWGRLSSGASEDEPSRVAREDTRAPCVVDVCRV